jgi:hypothetical protein
MSHEPWKAESGPLLWEVGLEKSSSLPKKSSLKAYPMEGDLQPPRAIYFPV